MRVRKFSAEGWCGIRVFKMRGRDINIDVDAGRSETLTIKPLKEGGETWDFSGVVVSGELRDIRTDELVVGLECGVTETGSIEVEFPALDGGQYVFAVDMSGGDGGATRLIDGYVTWGEPKAVIEETEETDERCLLVYVDGERRKAVWTWSKEAQRMYEEAKKQAERSLTFALRAEKAANSVSGSLQVQLLGDVDAALKEFDTKVSNAIQANTLTNTWWIAGKDTKVQVTGDKGDMGYSPYISALGNWVAWDEQRQQAVDTGVRAYGKDGVDGTAVRRVLINSVDELPKTPTNEAEAEKYRSFFYMVATGDGYDVYGLLETANGTFAWVNVGDSNALASATLYGLTKLGTDSIVNGAPVGVNASGGLATPAANVGDYGTVKLSYDSMPDSTNCIGLSPSGQLQVNKARLGSYGVVRLGSALGQVADIPYLVSVGSIESGDNEGKLANNLLIGGALKHMRTGSGNDGWNEDTVHGASFDSLHSNTFYLGLLLSNSFSQNQTDGLVLNPATPSTLGGVKIAYSLDAPGTDTVPLASQVKKGIADKITEALASYYPKSEVYTKAEVEQAINAAYDGIVDEVKKEMFIEMSADEYAKVTDPIPNVLYLIPEE